MAAFDTAITPTAVTPAVTTNTTLFTAGLTDASVLVDAANVGGTAPTAIRIGITPSGGAVHWKVFDLSLPVNESALSFGPFFLQTGDAITVRTADADEITFSLTGVESS